MANFANEWIKNSALQQLGAFGLPYYASQTEHVQAPFPYYCEYPYQYQLIRGFSIQKRQ